MRLVVLSDPHIGSPRVKDFWIEAFWRAFDMASREDKILIVPGDWFEAGSVVEPRLLNKVYCELSTLFKSYPDVRVLSILGNHDIPIANHTDNELEIEINSPLMLIEGLLPRLICASIPKVEVLRENKIPVVLLPYRPVKKLEEQLEVLVADEVVAKADKKVLVVHTSFKGQVLPSGKEEDRGLPVEAVKDFTCVISGHIHSYSSFKNVVVAGAPYQMKFGDTNGVVSIVEV